MQRACIQKGAFLTATFQKPSLPVVLNIFRNRKTVGIQTTKMPMCSSQIGGKTAWGSIPRNDTKWAVRLKIKPPVAMIRSVFISISSANGTERCRWFSWYCPQDRRKNQIIQLSCFHICRNRPLCHISCKNDGKRAENDQSGYL